MVPPEILDKLYNGLEMARPATTWQQKAQESFLLLIRQDSTVGDYFVSRVCQSFEDGLPSHSVIWPLKSLNFCLSLTTDQLNLLGPQILGHLSSFQPLDLLKILNNLVEVLKNREDPALNALILETLLGVKDASPSLIELVVACLRLEVSLSHDRYVKKTLKWILKAFKSHDEGTSQMGLQGIKDVCEFFENPLSLKIYQVLVAEFEELLSNVRYESLVPRHQLLLKTLSSLFFLGKKVVEQAEVSRFEIMGVQQSVVELGLPLANLLFKSFPKSTNVHLEAALISFFALCGIQNGWALCEQNLSNPRFPLMTRALERTSLSWFYLNILVNVDSPHLSELQKTLIWKLLPRCCLEPLDMPEAFQTPDLLNFLLAHLETRPTEICTALTNLAWTGRESLFVPILGTVSAVLQSTVAPAFLGPLLELAKKSDAEPPMQAFKALVRFSTDLQPAYMKVAKMFLTECNQVKSKELSLSVAAKTSRLLLMILTHLKTGTDLVEFSLKISQDLLSSKLLQRLGYKILGSIYGHSCWIINQTSENQAQLFKLLEIWLTARSTATRDCKARLMALANFMPLAFHANLCSYKAGQPLEVYEFILLNCVPEILGFSKKTHDIRYYVEFLISSLDKNALNTEQSNRLRQVLVDAIGCPDETTRRNAMEALTSLIFQNPGEDFSLPMEPLLDFLKEPALAESALRLCLVQMNSNKILLEAWYRPIIFQIFANAKLLKNRKLVRRFLSVVIKHVSNPEAVRVCFPEGHAKLFTYLNKQLSRKAREKETAKPSYEEFACQPETSYAEAPARVPDEDDWEVDYEDVENPARRKQLAKGIQNYQPLDQILDNQLFAEAEKKQANVSDIRTADSGKLLVVDSADEEEGSDEEETSKPVGPQNVAGKKQSHAKATTKKKLLGKQRHQIIGLQKYKKNPNGGGDAQGKNKHQPYAYISLNPKMVTLKKKSEETFKQVMAKSNKRRH